MTIKRDLYLDRLIRAKGDGFAKVITGIRRCGKSYLLFVVNCGQKRLYIQSAYRLPDSARREQETRGLRRIPDSFRKIVVVDGVQPFYTDEHGIAYMSLMDFMLKPELLV